MPGPEAGEVPASCQAAKVAVEEALIPAGREVGLTANSDVGGSGVGSGSQGIRWGVGAIASNAAAVTGTGAGSAASSAAAAARTAPGAGAALAAAAAPFPTLASTAAAAAAAASSLFYRLGISEPRILREATPGLLQGCVDVGGSVACQLFEPAVVPALRWRE